MGAAAAEPRPATGAGAWLELLRTPGVPRVVVAGLVARLPLGMNAIGIVLLIRASGEGYGAAGLVAAAYSLATAACSPLLGRLIDSRGRRRVLLPLAAGYPVALAGLVGLEQAGAALVALIPCAMAAGALNPPIGASVRALWPALVPRAELRATAYAMEASLQELFFLAGPLLVAAIVAVASPAAALLVSAAAGGIGTGLFATARAARHDPAGDAGAGRRGGALRSAGVRTVTLASMAMGIAFGAVEVSMPAFGEAHGSRPAGAAALAAISLGSLLGGLWIGARPSRRVPARRYELAILVFAAGLALPLLAGSVPAMYGLGFAGGLTIAPVFAAGYGLIDDTAPPGTTTEAFSWLSTAIVLGLALGTAAGGAIVEWAGTDGSLAMSCAAGFAGYAAVRAGRSSLQPG